MSIRGTVNQAKFKSKLSYALMNHTKMNLL